jgi:anti-sigma B factor antagonist
MGSKAAIREEDGVTIASLAGRITLGEATGMVRETIKDLLGKGRNKILLDLREVSYMDSAGLGELVGAYASVANAGGTIKLLHPQGKVKDLLAVTKLYTVFPAYEDEREAIRSFETQAAAGKLFL